MGILLSIFISMNLFAATTKKTLIDAECDTVQKYYEYSELRNGKYQKRESRIKEAKFLFTIEKTKKGNTETQISEGEIFDENCDPCRFKRKTVVKITPLGDSRFKSKGLETYKSENPFSGIMYGHTKEIEVIIKRYKDGSSTYLEKKVNGVEQHIPYNRVFKREDGSKVYVTYNDDNFTFNFNNENIFLQETCTYKAAK